MCLLPSALSWKDERFCSVMPAASGGKEQWATPCGCIVRIVILVGVVVQGVDGVEVEVRDLAHKGSLLFSTFCPIPFWHQETTSFLPTQDRNNRHALTTSIRCPLERQLAICPCCGGRHPLPVHCHFESQCSVWYTARPCSTQRGRSRISWRSSTVQCVSTCDFLITSRATKHRLCELSC